MTRILFALIGATICLTTQCGPAHAAEPQVTPELVCAVAGALRRPWAERSCAVAAEELAKTAEPRTLLALMVLESGMDREAQAWYVLGGRVVVDVGLLGAHCVVGRNGRCTNWPVRGTTPIDGLQVIPANIRAGAQVLAKKRRLNRARALDWYLGDRDGSRGRTHAVAVLLAAFRGVEIPTTWPRVRELARKIAAAVRRENKS